MLPDELIKTLLFITIFVFSFSSFMSGLNYVHEEIDTVSEMKTLDEIPSCEFETDYVSDELYSLPEIVEWYSVFSPDFFWRDSGNYDNPKRSVISNDLITGENNLELDNSDSGSYIIDLDLDNFDKTDLIIYKWESFFEIEDNQSIILSYKIINESNETVVENSKVLESNSSSFDFNIDYNVSSSDSIFRQSIFLVSDNFSDFESPVFKSLSVYSNYQEEHNIQDYIDCSISVLLEWGRSPFLDTGIKTLDIVFNFIGIISFVSSIILVIPLLFISVLTGFFV